MENIEYSDPNAKHELDFLSQYQNKGYTANFRVENNKLKSSENDSIFNPEQVKIVAEHRFEGMSNPSDNSILYVMQTNNGLKGTIINAYGPATNLDVHEFIESIPKENTGHDDSILNLS